MSVSTFNTALGLAATRVEAFLDATLPAPNNAIAEGMRYAVLNGGKRLRAFLVMEARRCTELRRKSLIQWPLRLNACTPIR